MRPKMAIYKKTTPKSGSNIVIKDDSYFKKSLAASLGTTRSSKE